MPEEQADISEGGRGAKGSPVLAIVLAVICFYRGPLPIIVAAGITTVLSETLISLATQAYTWGELLTPRLIASLMQAALLYWVVRAIGQRIAPSGGTGRRVA